MFHSSLAVDLSEGVTGIKDLAGKEVQTFHGDGMHQISLVYPTVVARTGDSKEAHFPELSPKVHWKRIGLVNFVCSWRNLLLDERGYRFSELWE